MIAPSLDDIAQIAADAWAGLPAHMRALAGDVLIRVEEFADDEVLDDMEIEDPFELTGLYQGVDLTRASITSPAIETPIVFLYRQPILNEWIGRGDVTLAELVAHVLVHEVGHHFGLSDEAIDAILARED